MKVKRKIRSVFALSLLSILICTNGLKSQAADEKECIDGSYLLEENYSEGESVNISRGIYLKSGSSTLIKEGTGKITAGGRTVGEIVVSKISVVVKVQKLVNGSWEAYTSWTTTKYNSALVSSSKTLSVPTGYYYRVCCSHYANSDVSGSYTDGIHV